MITHGLLAALAALLLPEVTNAQAMYSKNSAVLQADAHNYNKLVTKSNQVSIVEFYAPWCGHCQNLKPKYEKAAKSLRDLAQVVAVDCDKESNKPLCGSMGIQGFPTLKIVKPSKKPGKPIVEDYQGPRESKDIVEIIKNAIPNNVKRVGDKSLSDWLDSENSTAKAVLFSDKSVTSALTKVLANEFLGSLKFAQIRNKDAAANEMFGISEYPTLLVLPGGTQEPVVYDGAFTKAAMKDFLSQHTTPDANTLKNKVKEKVKETAQKVMGTDDTEEPVKAAESDEASFSSASASQQTSEASSQHTSEDPSAAASEASSAAASATEETLADESNPTESPEPAVTPESKPIQIQHTFEPISALEDQKELQAKCLGEKTSTCVLALLPVAAENIEEVANDPSLIALVSLAEVAEKHKERQGHLFPFYSVPASNAGAEAVRGALKLGGDKELEIIAVNGRRGWFRRFETGKFDSLSVETWIDNIRFGEGTKGKLPEELLNASSSTSEVPETESATSEESSSAPTHGEL
ncbi:uncharacterized protein KY384_008524 [Bacidia gigantensis]|uniref:uncharacterized protein n=1 Tax=Bacidia gigantensis TaxID=2732470 RepID=UPI001D03D145|nr:uncharacterized protein KY384_008524 [Bacidia gigantensis]KAG8527095.1 hypothetical protein KY384_008524 [Bacidia gigantensis]